jgi:hypothetical protein
VKQADQLLLVPQIPLVLQLQQTHPVELHFPLPAVQLSLLHGQLRLNQTQLALLLHLSV